MMSESRDVFRRARVEALLPVVLVVTACGSGPSAPSAPLRSELGGADVSTREARPDVSTRRGETASAEAASSSPSTSSPTSSAKALQEPQPPAGFSPIPPRRPGAFPGTEVAEVRAFAFDLEVSGRPVCDGPLADDGRLCSTVKSPGVVLRQAQQERLLSLVRSPATYGPATNCWLPHHGFVFYDAAGVPIAELAVCFLCDMVAGRPDVSAARGPSDGGRHGVTEKSNAELRALCRELGLPKCDARTPDDFGPGK